MSRDSRMPTAGALASSSVCDATRVIPVESVAAASGRSVTQVIPIGRGPEVALPTPANGGRSRAGGTTLVLALNEPHRHQASVDERTAAELCETPVARLQHTLIWPGVASRTDAAMPPQIHVDTSATNTTSVVETDGPITRIARPSEWLPSTASTDIEMRRQGSCVNQPVASADSITACVAPEPSDASASSGPVPKLRSFRAFEWLASLPTRHKVSLALAPFAVAASVYVVYPGNPRPGISTYQRSSGAMPLVPQPVAAANAEAPTPLAPTVPQPSSVPVRSHSSRTVLRQATDAIAEGNYIAARALFEQLQASEPNNGAYGSAIRIIDHSLSKSR